jgi:alkanesulfonate monooxygenase SsuD/methylene tetrahydromethanopterin reductase-like flavin-dependent oxidoreductase (luciferase family)
MDFGIVHAKIDEIGYITHAENLGYSHCWVTDSQMIRSNCWAVLALAAQQTRRMRLGTGVNVPGLRLAPVTANGIATINRLAPGRCFIGLGTGHTAMRTLGHKPMRLAPFKEYVQTVQALREPGEPANSDRLIAECGAAVISGLHYLVAHHLETGAEPPAYARPIWKPYLDWLNQAPPAVRHQRLHGSHYSFIDPEEARFLTPALIEATCLTGPPERVVERVKELDRQGLSQIMLYPPLNRQYRVIEDFADRVMARL